MCLSRSDGGDALGGAGHTHPTVTPQGLWIGVAGVHMGLTVGQLHRHQPRLVVGAHSLIGLDKRRVHDGLLPGLTAPPAGISGDVQASAARLFGQKRELSDSAADEGPQVDAGRSRDAVWSQRQKEEQTQQRLRPS